MGVRSVLVVVTVLALAACKSSDSAAEGDADGGPLGAAGTGLGTGLPCDVQAVIENRCIGCHDGSGAPPKLLTYDDLVAASTKDPAKSRAVVSVELMQGSAMPPRPAARPEADEIASFQDWVSAGTPKNATSCTDAPPGAGADGGIVSFSDAGGPTCTSGVRWTTGDTGSPLMHPGKACNTCHQISGGPNLRFAGTVYATAHDPDDCNGKGPPPTITVTVTDSRDRAFPMTVNEAGNFLLEVTGGGPPPRAPYKVSITDGTNTRVMNGSVTSGDCNSCHTVAGANGAPGRILAP